MRHKHLIIASGLLVAGLFASGSFASYAETCNKLIGAWEDCRAGGEACKAEEGAIESECKCHVKKGKEWKFVASAVGKDRVCEEPEDPPSDPPPPPHDGPPDRDYDGRPNAASRT